MASSPDVSADATAVEKPAAAKLPLVPLIAAMLVAVVLGAGGVGGVMFYLAKSGKLGGGGGAAIPKVEAHETAPPKTHALVLDPVLVNLADPGGRAYLRLGMTLRVLDDEPVKGEKPKEEKAEKGVKAPTEAETAVRDTVLTVLGQQTGDGLLEPDGKEALKTKLRAALAARNPTVKVTDLFFTEFLVQR